MTIRIPTAGLSLKALTPYNINYNQEYISQWRPVYVGENYYARDPQTGLMIQTRAFALNIEVDMTNPGGTGIKYVSEFGDELFYYPNYNGIHKLMHWGIISIDAGVNGQTIQWGI